MNQKGVSLPVVMLITALIAANSYYFLSLNKTAKTTNVSQTIELKEDAEKKRIAAFLADYTVCNSNLAGKTIAALKANPAAPDTSQISNLKKGGINFLNYGSTYAGGTHTLTRIFLLEDTTSSVVKTKYSLVASYTVFQGKTTAKKNASVTIPLYIDQDAGGVVTRCYARPDEDTALTGTKVEQAVQSACLGETALFANSGGDISCKHEVLPTSCISPGGVLTGNLLKDVEITSQHELKFNCGYLPISDCPTTTTPFPNLGTSISNSTVQCANPDSPAICPNGQAMVFNNGNTIGCASQCLPTTDTNLLHHSYQATSGSPICYTRPLACPPGKYAEKILANGQTRCGDIRYKGLGCPANTYVTDMDTESTGPNAPFTCSSYTKSKSCASAGTYTYVNSFNTVTPICVNYSAGGY